jgi:hypothetical protein
MDGMVTHIATLECLVTQPHRAVDCAIVMARRQRQEGAALAMRRQREYEQPQRKPQERV